MAIVGPSPSPDELKKLAAVFKRASTTLQRYLSSPAGQADANFTALTTATINLNNASDTIAVMQLSLATDQGSKAVGLINQTVAKLQEASKVRNDITRDVGIVQDLAAFGAAIGAGDIGSIIDSGTDLYNKLIAA